METKALLSCLRELHQQNLRTFDNGLILSDKVPCAICVLFSQNGSETNLILTQRARHLRQHAGQISFPGGRVEENDPDIFATALRETEEEIGLTASSIEIIGDLNPLLTPTGYKVTPVLGIIQQPYTLIINKAEVDDVLTMPLVFLKEKLCDFLTKSVAQSQLSKSAIPPLELHFEGYRIFGLTAHILCEIGCYFQTQEEV